jgi:H+/Cl- antiporter ClcA
VLNAIVFAGFEWVVNHGTVFIWDDVVGSDEVRWRVIPLAIVASLVFSLLVHALGQKRVGAVHTDPLAGDSDPGRVTLTTIGVILLVGAASLLAGASLGPEASLVAASAAIGAWIASGKARQLLVLTSVGALLVAFLGSLIPTVLPLLLLYRREKRLPVGAVLPILVACLASYGTLYLIAGNTDGYGDFPTPTDLALDDFATAFLLGAIGAGVGAALKWSVTFAAKRTARIDERRPWWVSATLFGAVIGLLYLVGGESVEFSGSEGTNMLLHEHAQDSAAVLAGLFLVKVLVTGWSLSAGYRGGLVFPSIYAGVAMSLLVVSLFSGLAGPGAPIGAVAGIIAAMTNPAGAIILTAALLPLKLLGLAVVGAIGAVVAQRQVKWRT